MHEFLFGTYPYIATAVMIVGSVARYERDPYTWKSSSSQMLARKQLIMGSVLFHIGILAIFGGHLVGLLTPLALWDALGVSHGFKQMIAIVLGGVAGISTLVGGGMLLHRRLLNPRVRARSSFADTSVLMLLVFQVILGLMTIVVSLGHLDGHVMTQFMAWAQGVATFDSQAASYITDVNILFKLHIFVGLTILLVFPFTRLVHMLSAPVRFLWRPGYQIVRTRRGK